MAVPTPAGMSKMNFITSLTASGSAAITIQKLTTSIGDALTTSALVVVCRALCPANSTVALILQLSSAGTVDTGSNYAYESFGAPFASGTEGSLANSAATTSFNMTGNAGTAGASFGTSAIIYIWSPFEAVSNKAVTWFGTQVLTATTGTPINGGGAWNSTAAVDGIKLSFSAGNISTGSVDLFQLVAQ